MRQDLNQAAQTLLAFKILAAWALKHDQDLPQVKRYGSSASDPSKRWYCGYGLYKDGWHPPCTGATPEAAMIAKAECLVTADPSLEWEDGICPTCDGRGCPVCKTP